MPNSLRQLPSRNFLGATSNPSKKGVATNSAIRMPIVVADDALNKVGGVVLTTQVLEEKRTDFLEKQEKKLRSAVNETRSIHNKLEEDLDQYNQKLAETIDTATKNHQKHGRMMEDIFTEQQWVYGKAKKDMVYIADFDSSSSHIKKKSFESRQTFFASEGEWVLFIYPMKNIEMEKDEEICAMRAKKVDPETGQLIINWVVLQVKSKSTGNVSKFVEEFRLVPGR